MLEEFDEDNNEKLCAKKILTQGINTQLLYLNNCIIGGDNGFGRSDLFDECRFNE